MSNKLNLYIIHAGLNHKSPYFTNLISEFNNYKNINIVITPDIPNFEAPEKGIIYFNRLKRFYDSEDLNSVYLFLEKINWLKEHKWKIIFTLHNFFPIDRNINNNDEILLKEFLLKLDKVFVFSEYMKKSLKNNFGIEAINHSIGINVLDGIFDNDINLPSIKENSTVFTFIGNISKYKMLDSVIKAFEKISKYNNCYLIIAGPSNNQYKLEYKENKNIIRIDSFIGDKAWDKLCNISDVIINSYDINIENFKYGFFPSNCIQIRNKKKFCIVPKSNIFYEFLPKGYYLEYETEKDIISCLEYVIKNKKIILNLENDYPKYENSWKKMVEIIVDNIMKIW